MVYLGLHGLVGLGVDWWVANNRPLNLRLTNLGKLSYVVGNVIPDFDLLGAVFVMASGGGIADIGSIHRTFSHSLVTISAIILLGIIIGKTLKGREKYQTILMGIGVGMLTHVAIDLTYMVGVSVFWPFEIGTYIPGEGYRVGLLWNLPSGVANLNSALEFLFFAIFIYALFLLIRRVDLETKALDLRIFSFLALVVFLSLGAYGMTLPQDDTAFMMAYGALGFPYLLLSIYFPYKYRRGIYAIGKSPRSSG